MDAINALQTSDKVAAPKAGLTGEFDAYVGRINRIAQSLWIKYLNPSDSETIIVNFIMTGNGKLVTYRFTKSTYDQELMSKARDLMEKLKLMEFPPPPNGERFEFELLLEPPKQ